MDNEIMRDEFEQWVMTKICISKSTLVGLRADGGYRNTTLSGRDYNLMWDAWKESRSALKSVGYISPVGLVNIRRNQPVLISQSKSKSTIPLYRLDK